MTPFDARPLSAWPAVGFDLDGTLIDHRGAVNDAVQILVRSFGHEPSSELLSAWFRLESEHFESWRAGRVSFAQQRRLRIGPLLRRLRAQGVRVGVLTNGNHAQQVDKLAVTGVASFLDVVCTAERLGVAKPHPRAFAALVNALGYPASEIAFVGDSLEHDVEGARGAGIPAGLVARDGAPATGLEAALRSARL